MPDRVRAAADAAIRRHVCDLVRDPARGLLSAATLATHCPMRGEPGGPELLPALTDALGPTGTVVLPLLLPDLDLDWARYDGTLVDGQRGLRHPPGPALGTGAVTAADLVIVPAVAVDRTGVRLGRGGGSYDRALARVPDTARIVALLYPGELLDALPAAGHDQRVGGIVTPDGFLALGDDGGVDAPARMTDY